MALVKIADLYPSYKENIFGGEDIKSFSVYDLADDKIGSVYDILVDENGRFRYLVIDTGFWIFGKKVLLPVGRASINYSQKRVYASNLTKEQAENLPEYDDDMTIDYNYEEKVRGIYRDVKATPTNTGAVNTAGVDTAGYTYDREPNLYAHQDTDEHQSLKLYEERLVANKERFHSGTVTVSKRVETETASVSVPVERERLIVERTTPTSTAPVAPGEATFNEGEVARVELYEDSAKIEKQVFVREEVNVRKEVEKDTVSAQETIRREELDTETDGNTVINRNI